MQLDTVITIGDISKSKETNFSIPYYGGTNKDDDGTTDGKIG